MTEQPLKHLLDLRDELDREAEPLGLYFEGFEATALDLATLEQGEHHLTPEHTYLVVCEVGQKSKLAVMYLQADGIQASHLEGGILGLRKQTEQEHRLPYSDALFKRGLLHPRVRFVARDGDTLVIRGALSQDDLRDM
ncbi:rhodanese-like domain-containing protein [Deinococcus misasensis]|uniref:rhodanese-like domain-containing protein n=1 Tax=Deinococcus misasensis TaxID=392413 RepID=UPI0012FAB909|nr:rhodanese-like domain-containing protein [Deinococcus misasensis]